MSPLVSKKRKRRSAVSAGKPRRHRLRLPGAPGEEGVDLSSMSPAMVDRLFWRAGFGPTDNDRAAWTGKPVSEAVAWLLSAPAGVAGSPGTREGKPLDPTGDDTDLVLSWVDQMIRSTNPFVERMAFFWHRHWANSRDEVSPPQLLLRQNEPVPPVLGLRRQRRRVVPRPRLRGDGRPGDAALPHRRVQREGLAERELRPRADGALRPRRPGRRAVKPNYSENDVRQLAKALSGWQINDTDPDNAKSYFTPGPLVQRAEDRLRQVRQLQAERGRRPRARPSGPRALPRRASSGASSSSRRRTRRRSSRWSRPTPAAA